MAVCQYPLTKKIGDQSVVIMTTKQAEDINARFLRMRDTITTLRLDLQSQQVKHKSTVNQLTDSLSVKRVDIRYKEGEANWYKKEYYQYKNESLNYLSDVRTSMYILVSISAILTAVVTIIIK